MLIMLSNKKLSFFEKVGYGVGDLAHGHLFTLMSLYLLYFYTDVLGITAVSAGAIFLVTRIWDAANDPLMGYLADHTHSKWGKFRPYLLFGAVLLGLATFFCYFAPDIGSNEKFVYAFITYLVFGMAYTMAGIPYGCMIASMTQDTLERSSLSAYRNIFSLIGAVLAACLIKPVINTFSSEKEGFMVTMGCVGIICAIILFITFLSTKERIVPKKEKKIKLKEVLQVIFKNRPLILLTISIFFNLTAFTLRNGMGLFYCKYNLGNEGLFPYLAGAMFISFIIGILFIPLLNKKIDKAPLYNIGNMVSLIGYLGVFLAPYSNIPMIFFFTCLFSVGSAAPTVLQWSMLSDTVEYSEWKTGIRAVGLVNSIPSFAVKSGLAVGGALSGLILSASGYIPDVEQSPKALFGILSLLTLLPAVLTILAIVAVCFYTLNKKTFNKIVQNLKEVIED
jgi:GPH family glycoside/pentoside/hexuronide:cation symporter